MRVIPTIDFGHIHARNGETNKEEDFGYYSAIGKDRD